MDLKEPDYTNARPCKNCGAAMWPHELNAQAMSLKELIELADSRGIEYIDIQLTPFLEARLDTDASCPEGLGVHSTDECGTVEELEAAIRKLLEKNDE